VNSYVTDPRQSTSLGGIRIHSKIQFQPPHILQSALIRMPLSRHLRLDLLPLNWTVLS
jgi:hypothetical protein